jgi:hypothetical protein
VTPSLIESDSPSASADESSTLMTSGAPSSTFNVSESNRDLSSSSTPERRTNFESESPSISLSALATPLSSNPLIVNVLQPSNLTSDNLIELSGALGKGPVGALRVPAILSNQANTTLITSYSSSPSGNSTNQQVLFGTILNITLLDGQGNAITQLDSLLTICLALPNTTAKGQRVCLSYYDERKDKWRCEDECLTNVVTGDSNAADGEAKGMERLLCGQTGHLTNFALLLVGSVGEDPCKSDKDSNTLAWISLGMVIGAVFVVSLSVLIIEVYIRWKHLQSDKELRDLALFAKSKSVTCL